MNRALQRLAVPVDLNDQPAIRNIREAQCRALHTSALRRPDLATLRWETGGC
jgi:hypothetical protein